MDKNKGVKIGIVIPIYNVAKYLRECLDSVANQTYKNFHAVLVNDGSTDFVSNSSLTQSSQELEKSSIDRQQALSHSDFSAQPTNLAQDTRIADLSKNNISQSLQIALDYVSKDSRFVLIDKENGGQSSARNAGIAYFNGKIETSLRGRITDSHEAIQSKNKSCDSTNRISPDSRCKKSESKGAVVPPADFLLESELRGSPPKSEKAAAFWRVGGAGRGVQPLLRKEIGESNSKRIANDSQIAKVDSSLTAFAQNGESSNLTLYTNKNATNSNPPQIDYIIFLDSDDFWELDLLEKCVDSARIAQQSNHNLDIIWFDWNEIYEVSGKIQGRTTLELFGFTTQTQITATQWLIQAQKKRVISFWFSVMGLIRFDYLRRVNLRFLEGVIFEDNLFGVLLFSQCESIAIVPCKLYNYRIRGGSTTNSTKLLPPFVAPLKAHFSTDSEAWAYFCAYSLCEMSLEFANFCANLSEKNRSKRCESAFLPNFLAESCDILAFGSDPLNAKSRFIALLKKQKKYSPYLKIIAHIVPRRFKRLRFALFLFYFAPKVAFFRTTRKILKTLRICCE